MSQLSLIDGPFPWVTAALAVLGLGWLAVADKRTLSRAYAILLIASALVVGALYLILGPLLNIVPPMVPIPVWLAVIAAFFAIGASIVQWRRRRRRIPRATTVGALIAVVLLALTQVNVTFALFPTVGTLWGDNGVQVENLDAMPQRMVPPGTPPVTLAAWTPSPAMPAKGRVVQVKIPGTVSKLPSGNAYVYLPPAFLDTAPANVPVLVLVHGLPGGASDWLRSGQVAAMMDRFAAANKGIAPLVVMPDLTAPGLNPNPLCMDSSKGNALTYLTQDVPAWVTQTFGVGRSSAQRAIAGLSFGGTCALQAAAKRPDAYQSFIELSGEPMQSVPEGQDSLINTYFGGDAGAYRAQDPLTLFATTQYPPGFAGIVVVGNRDEPYTTQGLQITRAAQAAGLNVSYQVLPGAHSWDVWKPGLEQNLGWLMQRFSVS
ncbi:alpha/beta hydrolase [Haematomicrobium sanguinis]|uniref:alpha/beta hydrolase n=1 Tax=Haematomicrobium sanguinis TaxID=479106 RepID=UPI00047DA046|nr:alpha/beta hydrolase-fold protein [Haematomicrobium sanguinis]